MLRNPKNLAVGAAIAIGCCGIAEGGNTHGAGVPYNSPYCGPCIPGRVSYGYFPTIWRRWPAHQVQPVPAQQPETLPTPAEPATPEIPDMPLVPTQPDTVLPEQPDKPPEEPPFGQPPAMPKADESPIELPFSDEPPPFDDAPPVLPTEPKDPGQPSFDPTVPPQATPSEEAPAPAKTPALDSDMPPTMPADDPFKDDPDQDDPDRDVGPPAGPPSQSSARDELERIVGHASIGVQSATASPEAIRAPGRLGESLARPLGDRAEPVHPKPGGSKVPSPLLPPARDNPLRSAARTIRPREIVPTASFSAADTATPVGRGGTWRPNPLRSD